MIRRLRLALAKWLWPKQAKVGDLFTFVYHKTPFDGKIRRDGSWIGDVCRIDRVDGDRIEFSVWNDCQIGIKPYFDHVSMPKIPGQDCEIKLILARPLPEEIRLMKEEMLSKTFEMVDHDYFPFIRRDRNFYQRY